jgi:hypothetical protein
MEQPKLLDVVALLQSNAFAALHMTDERHDLSSGLPAGTVGTVVEVSPRQTEPPVFLVEFSDAQGCGYAFATIPADDLLVLHYAPSESATAYPLGAEGQQE